VAPRPENRMTRSSPAISARSAQRGLDSKTYTGHKTSPLTRTEVLVIELYARGLTRRRIARLMLDHLAPPNGDGLRIRLRIASRRLRHLEQRKWFRDALWETALIRADLQSPRILAGVTDRASHGHVDAAKLALGITGRYQEQSDVQATQVNIVFGADIPRPEARGIESRQAAEDVVEDAEWDEINGR
jgi:hypothetical protein